MMIQIDHDPRESRHSWRKYQPRIPRYKTGVVLPDLAWDLYQASVFLFFLFGNIYFEWGMDGLAAGVLGGLAAWFSSAIIGYFLSKLPVA